MSRPTVAFVAQPWARMLPPSESVAIGTREIARRLAHELRVIVYARGGRTDIEVEREDGVEYRLVPAELDWRAMKALAPLRRLSPARRPFFASSLFHPVYFRAVAHDLARLRPALVHVHNFSQFLPWPAAPRPEAGSVLHMHCDWLADLSRPMVARRLESADLVLGCSDHVARRIRARFPGAAARVETRLNGVDVERFQPVADPPQRKIFFAGRVAPDKGLHVLCDAFRRLRARFPDLALELVGPEAPVSREMQVALSSDPLVRGLDVFYGGATSSTCGSGSARTPPRCASRGASLPTGCPSGTPQPRSWCCPRSRRPSDSRSWRPWPPVCRRLRRASAACRKSSSRAALDSSCPLATHRPSRRRSGGFWTTRRSRGGSAQRVASVPSSATRGTSSQRGRSSSTGGLLDD